MKTNSAEIHAEIPKEPGASPARIHELKGFEKVLEKFFSFCARMIVKATYKLEYIDFDKIPKDGPAILIANHITYMDGLLIHGQLRRRVHFLIDEFIYKLPLVNFFMRLDQAIPIAPNRVSVSMALDMMTDVLAKGDILCLFPEGQLTYTGHLGHFKPGIEWIIKRYPVKVYPVVIEGMWGSVFSRKYRKSKSRWIPRSFRRKVTIMCGDPVTPDNIKAYHLQTIINEMRQMLHDNEGQ
ncbi:MAG: 1-acyl-sn-glycerol-3-phosphate acyltransferase [Alphaproteobacteria bacterium]|nr:1-acyl-sn-glycerol-3-phosphate acyltransferase [Alphaproteobacteria bacterium]